MNLKLNNQQMQYLAAYGKLWGYDAEWAAMHFLMHGMLAAIDRESLTKTRDSFALARQITKSKG